MKRSRFGLLPATLTGPVTTTVALCLLGGCVTMSEHERALADASSRMNAVQQQHAAELAASQSQVVSLQTELASLKQQLADRQLKITETEAQVAALQQKLDDATALSEQLTAALRKTGKNVDKLLAEKGKMHDALGNAKKRLEELRKAQLAASKRAELFRQLALKFKKMTDSGDLKIVLRDGRMVLQLRNDVLFDSGKVTVKKAGKDALKEVAGVLVTLTDRKLQVAGHTDNVPISTARFASNWELSSARAIAVVKFLVGEKVNAKLLSAAGYSENDPVSANDSDENKAKNRRIEIVLQPNIGELVSVPESTP